MDKNYRLRVDGAVDDPVSLTYEDLAGFAPSFQITDVSQLDPSRRGSAVTLEGILARVRVRPDARFLGLHSGSDDFHASIPLSPVRHHAVLIYCVDGQPLAPSAGGPVRLFIPRSVACHTGEIDECANVKHLEHIELTREKGHDNRPIDDAEHERLHQRESR